MTTCITCGCSIPSKKNRCSLNELLLTTLNKLSPSIVSAADSGKIQYVCKKCKLKLQRFHSLKKQVSELQKSILDSLPSIAQAHPSATACSVPLQAHPSATAIAASSVQAHPSTSVQALSIQTCASPVTSPAPTVQTVAPATPMTSHRGRRSAARRVLLSSTKRRRRLALKEVESLPIAHNGSRTPDVAITVFHKSKPKTYLMTPQRRQICKPLTGSRYCALARKCLHDYHIKKYIIKGFGTLLRKDIALLCSDDEGITRKLTSLQWTNLLSFMKSKTPTLLSILQSCMKTKKAQLNQDAIIGVIASVLCKHRRSSVSLFQRMVSLILYTGHASKKVYQRLQKVGICLSHQQTIRIVDGLSKDFDKKVLEWKSAAENAMDVTAQPTRSTSVIFHDHVLHSNTASVSSASLPEVSHDNVNVPNAHSSFREDHVSPDILSLTSLHSCNSSSDESSVIIPDSPTISDPSDIVSDISSIMSQTEQKPWSPLPASEDNDTIQELVEIAPCVTTPGFKFVVDNVDSKISPRFMREDAQSQSLHYVQLYAVKDRIDYSSVPDSPPSSTKNIFSIIPSSDDYTQLKKNMAILVARILVEHIRFFSEDFRDLVTKHIPHKYSDQMSQKSEVVPLGVLPYNEINYEDMISILQHVQKYVPAKTVNREVTLPDQGRMKYSEQHYAVALIGGDQLTVARARGAQKIRSNSFKSEDRLDGVLPVAEDWHGKMCLLQVIWNRLYKTNSGMQRGTLYHLRNFINRRNVTKKCKKDMNACEDFFETVVTGHVLACAMSMLGMSEIGDLPDESIISRDAWMMDDTERKKILMDVATKIVDDDVDLSTTFYSNAEDTATDGVHAYACETLSLGLLYFEFQDAIKEGDGNRVMRIWKYLLLLFKASKRKKNYSIEALTLLSQYHVILPPRLAEQLKWSRFVNVHGTVGHNISCDLHMEHLNREIKTAIKCLGANKSQKAIIRTGKAIGVLSDCLGEFDEKNEIISDHGTHAVASAKKDLMKVLKQLRTSRVFMMVPGRKHKSFRTLKTNLIKTIKQDELKEWILDHYYPIQFESNFTV